MKAILAPLALASLCLALAACESDVPPAAEAGSQLRRGLSGQGAITQPDRSEDPLIKENSRVGY